MSTGYGRVERALLEEIAQVGRAVIAAPDMSRSQVESRRRAARKLAQQGLVGVTHVPIGGKSHVVAMSVDAALERERCLAIRRARELQTANGRNREALLKLGLDSAEFLISTD